jgi:hypothetical protein
MFEFFIGLAVGMMIMALAVKIIANMAVRYLERQLQELEKTVEQLDNLKVPARVEEHQGIFYVYALDGDRFLAQGTSMAELKQRVESHSQTMHVVLTEGDPDVLARLQATSAEASNA